MKFRLLNTFLFIVLYHVLIALHNVYRNLTGEPYNWVKFYHLLYPTFGSDALRQTCQFESDNLGFHFLFATVLNILGTTTLEGVLSLQKIPFSSIFLLMFSLLFFVELGKITDNKSTRLNISLFMIGILLLKPLPIFALTRFFFGNACYGWALLLLSSLLMFDFKSRLDFRFRFLLLFLIFVLISMYHTSIVSQIILTFSFVINFFIPNISQLYRFRKPFLNSNRFKVNLHAPLLIFVLCVFYLLYVHYSFFALIINATQSTGHITNLLSFSRDPFISNYLYYPTSPKLLLTYLSNLSYILLLAMLIRGSISHYNINNETFIIVKVFIIFAVLAAVFFFAWGGISLGYQRVIEYSWIFMTYLIALFIYNNNWKWLSYPNKTIVVLLVSVLVFTTIIDWEFSERYNYIWGDDYSTMPSVKFFSEKESHIPLFASLKACGYYILVNNSNVAYPLFETNQEQINIAKPVFKDFLYAESPNPHVIFDYCENYGARPHMIGIITSTGDHKIGWMAYDQLYKPLKANFKNGSQINEVYNNGNTLGYLAFDTNMQSG